MVNGTAAGIDIHEQITIIAVHNAIMVISLVSILLDNAVKYCPKNGSISVSLVRSRKNAILEVTNDTQETPSPEMLKNMFERFYRSDASRDRKTGGYGIGLSIAKAVTEKHKGRITAASKAEKQLTVTVTL